MKFFLPFLLFSFFSVVFGQWNLPYRRPAVYDYSPYYSTEINDYLKNKFWAYQEETTKAWRYFKKTFIMSNGLVNHARWDNSKAQVVGTDDAVSEGQGYGMILAVLNNDQATFDKVFKGANSQLWNGSSYTWKWKGGHGSATDADLDIALALVFADMLEQKKFWKPSSGTAYGKRAQEVIGALRTKMCSQDYLLPGDSWGGGALDKQNPSYFSTAAMKVFDQYQSQHNFSKVVDNCYQVLTKAPRYNKGQVPNWMTRNGGRTDPGQVSDNNPYGMGNDAIRTPWRIAMDALWFNEDRAIAYCKNTKNTLTAYKTSSVGLLKQMGLYDDGGKIIANTLALPDYTAMWITGILGSKDKDFTTNALKGRIFSVVTGPKDDFLGNKNVKDNKFYYKQAVGQLGLALFTGQFPNVYADLKGDFKPLIQVTKPFSISPASLASPQTVTFSAEFSESTDWVLILTGKTTNVMKEFRGTGKSLSTVWNGEGYPKAEAVQAVLKVKDTESFEDTKSLTITKPFDPSNVFKARFKNPARSINLVKQNGYLLLVSKLDFAAIGSVSVFSLDGRRLARYANLRNIKPGCWRLDAAASSWQPGIYYLVVSFKGDGGFGRVARKVLL